MKFTKIMSLVLVFIMLFTVLVSCVNDPAGDDSETTTGGDVTTADPNVTTEPVVTGPETDADGYEVDDLPEMKWDDTFHLFSWSNQLYWEFTAEEATGTPIYDEVYYRKEYLKSEYGITVQVSSASGHWDDRDSFIKTVEANQSETGDNAWDAVGCYFAVSGAMIMKGFFDDLTNEEYGKYINLDKPWWPSDLLGSAKINGSVYSVTGDITPTFIRNLSVCHVNLDMLEKYNPGVDIYELVLNKEWTYEKLMELALGKVSMDDPTKLEYAVTMDSNVLYDDIFYSSGMTMVENLEDGSIQLADLGSDEKFLDFYEFSRKFLVENADVQLKTMHSEGGFASGTTMFHIGNAAQIQNYLTEVEWNYAAVPMPMYKTSKYTSQDEYHSVQGFWVTLYSIPTNCADHDLSSFAIEALASYGYRHLTPTWFEVSFQQRFLQTPENAEMFQIIRDGVIFDTARIFGTHINCFGLFRKAAQDTDWMSYYAENETAWKNKINEINQALGS